VEGFAASSYSADLDWMCCSRAAAIASTEATDMVTDPLWRVLACSIVALMTLQRYLVLHDRAGWMRLVGVVLVGLEATMVDWGSVKRGDGESKESVNLK
jgi:hypothetical protein